MIREKVQEALKKMLADTVPATEVAHEAPGEEHAPIASPSAGPVTVADYASKGYHLEARVPADLLVSAVEAVDRYGFFIEAITGVDWLQENEMEAVYDFGHYQECCRVVLKVRVPRDNPEIPTISHIYGGANWHERETHDFFGIRFSGHPDLSPLLLPEDADFHPLLKDFRA